LLLLFGLVWLAVLSPVALEARSKKSSSPDPKAPPTAPKGALFLHGGGAGSLKIRERILDYLQSQENPKDPCSVRVFVIPLGYKDVDESESAQKLAAKEAKEYWEMVGVASCNIYVTWSSEKDQKAIRFAKKADVIWLMGGYPKKLMDRLHSAGLVEVIRACYRKGAVFGGTCAGAVVAADHIVYGRDSRKQPLKAAQGQPTQGLGLLKGAYVETHIIERAGRTCALLGGVINQHAELAIGIGEKASFQLTGQTLEVFGEGSVVIVDGNKAKKVLKKPQHEILACADPRVHVLRPGMRFDCENRRVIVGSNSLGSAPKGALFLHGGGSGYMKPREEIKKYFEEKRAPIQKVRLLLIPLGVEAQKEDAEDATKAWLKVGVKKENIVVLDHEWLDKNSPEKARRIVKEYDAIWVLGGDQWKLMKALQQVKGLPEAIRKKYLEGGVYSGTSAGSVIAAGDIVDARDRLLSLKTGVLKQTEGLQLLPYAIIDTHFLQRDRTSRLFASVLDFNTHLGIGIDKGTFIKVENGTLTVFGSGAVIIIDGSQGVQNPFHGGTFAGANLGVHVLGKGMKFDLTKRKVVHKHGN
jgi:cyanophycinase